MKANHIEFNSKVLEVTKSLSEYCLNENFKGWDPYDGLNSKVFKFSGLNNFSIARLAWIQFFKRCPFNFRNFFLVNKGYNAKGLGLFLSGYSKLYKNENLRKNIEINSDQLANLIKFLGDKLLNQSSLGYSGMCWGYNFDWQARGGLYFKTGTPTVVATTYAAYGLFDAYEAIGEKKYLDAAIDSTNFVLKDLSRDYRDSGSFLFSYSVKPGNNKVYNASLLGTKLLSRAYYYTNNNELIKNAKLSLKAVLDAQEDDGSWIYGELPIQNWKDSFHTGFNLESISDYIRFSADTNPINALNKGYDYYINNFFCKNGTPKYYNNKTYPIDIHSPAQLIITVQSLNKWNQNKDKVRSVLNWTIKNMFDSKGYFYYQKKKLITSKIPYMRWSNAWMLNTLITYMQMETNEG